MNFCYEIPRVALSPVEDALNDDLVSLFSTEMENKTQLCTLQSPSTTFSTENFGNPRPPEVDSDTLLLDVLLSELDGATQETTPLSSTPTSSEPVSPAPLECTNQPNFVDPLDDPFLTEDYDFSEFLNGVSVDCEPPVPTHSPSPVNTTQFEMSECMQLFPNIADTTLDLSSVTDSELNQLIRKFSPDCSESETTTPEPLSPSSPQQSPQATRKRPSTAALPPAKMSKEDKQTMRRIKNNEASKVSRAKRRAKHSNIFSRETELISENAKLREEIKDLEAETEKLKKLLVQRLK